MQTLLRNAFFLLLITVSVATAADPWIGQAVFYKEGAKAHVGDQERDVDLTNDLVSFPAIVEAVDGELLWLGRAWMYTSDVRTVDQALDYYSDLIRRSPSSLAYLWRGSAWLAKGELDKAIRDCTLDGESWSAHNTLGLIWQKKREFDKAIECYTTAIRINPKHFMAYGNRGGARAEKGQQDLAIKDFNTAIELDPWYPKGYYNRGYTFKQRGDFDKAIEDFSQAIKLDPKYEDALISRGTAWHAKGDLNKAIEDYSKAIALHPTSAMGYYNRGLSWCDKGNLDDAIKDFTEAISIESSFAIAYVGRGSALREKGDFDGGMKDFMDAIRLDPKSPEGYTHIARLQSTCSDPLFLNGDEAVSMATKACDLTSWKAWGKLDTLAAAYAECSDFENAVKWQQAAIDLAKQESAKRGGRKRLELYENRKPCREGVSK
ncbi:MAG TPA: tetratricopeptide repeat protein [Pirellulales bacterium]|jgi:tetratricopeptide (TPR) repeat protein